MERINLAVVGFLKQWWFTIVLVMVLIGVAIFATPAGQTLASRINQITIAGTRQYLPFISYYLQVVSASA
jgi:hypothetical protein